MLGQAKRPTIPGQQRRQSDDWRERQFDWRRRVEQRKQRSDRREHFRREQSKQRRHYAKRWGYRGIDGTRLERFDELHRRQRVWAKRQCWRDG